MKTYRILFAAAMLSVVACSKEQNTDIEPTGKVFTFEAVTDNETKAVIGNNENEKPQTFWENSDLITVYSADAAEGYQFFTSLTENSASATFSYVGDFVTSDKYMAIHPVGGSSFSFDGLSISGVEIPAEQTLVAGSFDRTAAVSVAYSAGETTLPFKNATALVKFQVADGLAVSGSVDVSEGEYIAGTFTAALDSENEMKPSLTATEGASSVAFKIDGTTPLSKGTDYYVSVAPATLADGFDVTVAYAGGSYIKKTYDVSAFDRNTIYNVGDLKSNENVSKIELNFDFADRDDNWDTVDRYNDRPLSDIVTSTFTLNGEMFTFKTARKNPGTNVHYWPYVTSADKFIIRGEQFVALPAIEGYKLVEVWLNLESRQSSAGKTCITAAVTNDTVTTISGGDLIDTVNGGDNRWVLSNTESNTVYYIYQAGGAGKNIGVGQIKLAYEKVTE